MQNRLKSVVGIFLPILLLMACDAQVPANIETPSFLKSYQRNPFGDQQFAVFKRVFDPIWEELKPQHADLSLTNYSISSQFSQQQASKVLKHHLGDGWMYDPEITGQSRWGWSLGFRRGDRVFVLIVAQAEQLEIRNGLTEVPAGIVADVDILTANH